MDAELLAVVERSPAATARHDRAGWIGLFTPDGRVEDPYGSRPHVGHDQIGRFYDTAIAPRQIIFHRDADLVADAAVVRDLMLEIVMAPGVTLNVPMHLQYDLRARDSDWQIARLRAHWELPAMVVQMLRTGVRGVPVSLRMVADLLRHQGVAGVVGFAVGVKRPGRRKRQCVRTLLDAAVAGDEVTVRRLVDSGAVVTVGEDTSIAVGEFVDRLRGGRWRKLIAAGDSVSATVDTPAGRAVVFCEIPRAAAGITRIRYFGRP